jgi:aryl-alcohol dehydrogenase-like predicted oxidoreductase
VETIAKKRNISMAQVALAWSLSKPFITAPIVGTTSLDKLDDLIKGCEVELTAEEIKEIDDEYKTQSVIGHN